MSPTLRIATLTPTEAELVGDIGGFYADPLGFVEYVFAWGEGRLATESGPDTWQRDVLGDLGRHAAEDLGRALQIAVASGHGIGKSALVAWIILWFASTRDHPQIVVTANTCTQLNTKTWRELAKWHRLAINHHWFEWTATKFTHVLYPETWFACAIPWNVHRSEAFAGAHEKYLLILFDEASAIDDRIWEVAEGAMTTAGGLWIAFGNPTRNTGRFRECFGKFKHRWLTRQIDSRAAKKAQGEKIAQWIEDYGEDSDFVRVRVRGVFPRAGSHQFIGLDLVHAAQKYTASAYEHAAKIIGVDVARHGDDQTVILRRQGQKVWKPKRLRISDLMRIASLVAEEIDDFQADACFIDASGIGWGVYDRLRQLNYKRLHPVQVGEAANDPRRFYNLRMEIWDHLRSWLKEGADLPDDDQELADDLTGPEYGFDAKERLQLEKKEDMKERGLASPDAGDALALTFTAPVQPRLKREAGPRYTGEAAWMR